MAGLYKELYVCKRENTEITTETGNWKTTLGRVKIRIRRNSNSITS